MIWYMLVLGTVGVWAEPVVEIDQGWVRGVRADDGNYSMFMGIPYAVVDHNNPFGPAVPKPQFDGVFVADDDTALCPQVNEFTGELDGTLECLHVNVYVPDRAQTEKLPVLVWIFGGAFRLGFARRFLYGPKYIVRHDVILVTLNYRLGPYGFMCPGTERVPGNQGIKDQVLALRWVRDNIEAFGGDAENVTVSGNSAGAIMIETHLLSTAEKLFKRAIIQSGSVIRPDNVLKPSEETTIKLVERLGYETNNTDDAIDFLSKEDVLKVINASLTFSELFRPCYEDNFLQYPFNYNNDKIRTTQILSGHNNQERLLAHVFATTEQLQARETFKVQINNFNLNNDKYPLMMRRFYIGDEEVTEDVRWEIIDFDSDYTFAYPVHRSINKFLKNGADVYFYIFSYSGGRNFAKYRFNVTEGTASHADEVGYLFDMQIFESQPAGTDKLMLDRMTTMWTNFAKYGDPTPETSELLPVKWLPATPDKLYCLYIDAEFSVSLRPLHDRMAFWDMFYKVLENRNANLK